MSESFQTTINELKPYLKFKLSSNINDLKITIKITLMDIFVMKNTWKIKLIKILLILLAASKF